VIANVSHFTVMHLMIYIFKSETDLPYCCSYGYCCRGNTVKKSLRLHCFKSDRGEIWQDCSWSKYASIDRVGFLIRCHALKVAAMMSVHCLQHGLLSMCAKIFSHYSVFVLACVALL